MIWPMGFTVLDTIATRRMSDGPFERGFWNGTAWGLTLLGIVWAGLFAITGIGPFAFLACLDLVGGLFLIAVQRRAHGSSWTRLRRE